MTLKTNIVANYASQIYVTAVSIITVPLYVQYMGAEAYGLVGFFAMMQVWFSLLDLGLTPTMARESSRFYGGVIDVLEYRRLARALEGLFGMIGLIGGGILLALAVPIAESWLTVNDLELNQTILSLQLMALVVAFRWMSGFYRGVITGAERLVWLSAVSSVVATGRFVFVLPVMMFINASPTVFFIFQLVVGIFELILLAIKAYRLLPEIPVGKSIHWQWAPIKPVLKFSLSIAITSSIWVLVTQTDKLMLSKILPLAEYGYFSVAVLLASGIMIISGPISNALMPRMARLQAEGQYEELLELYRQATQMVAMVAVPTTLILAFLSSKVLLAWTGDVDLVTKAAPTLTLYAVGYGFLALGAFPYYLQYAKGDLKLHLIGNVSFVIILIPLVIWATNKYGMVGAGWAWLLSNAIYFFTWVPLVHRKFAPGLHKKWILIDIAPIVLPAIFLSYFGTKIVPWSDRKEYFMIELLVFGVVMVYLCAPLKYKKFKF